MSNTEKTAGKVSDLATKGLAKVKEYAEATKNIKKPMKDLKEDLGSAKDFVFKDKSSLKNTWNFHKDSLKESATGVAKGLAIPAAGAVGTVGAGALALKPKKEMSKAAQVLEKLAKTVVVSERPRGSAGVLAGMAVTIPSAVVGGALGSMTKVKGLGALGAAAGGVSGFMAANRIVGGKKLKVKKEVED